MKRGGWGRLQHRAVKKCHLVERAFEALELLKENLATRYGKGAGSRAYLPSAHPGAEGQEALPEAVEAQSTLTKRRKEGRHYKF
jgi:hypothetical protein